MESHNYLPESYQSKLNTLFKPILKTSRNSTFFPHRIPGEGAQFPILIPSSTWVDQNILDNHSSPTSPNLQSHPIFEHLFTPTPTTTIVPVTTTFNDALTTTTPDFGNGDTILDLDLDGNIAHPPDFGESFTTTPQPPSDFQKLLNRTLWNVSSIVNDFLSTAPTPITGTPIIQNDDIDLTTTATTVFLTSTGFPNNNSDSTNSTLDDNLWNSTTPKPPPIFRDISPIASTELLVTYGFFVLFLAIVGVVSNSATIHVLFRQSINLHIKKHYTNMTILSLAIVNLVASIFVGLGGGLNVLVIGFGSIAGNRMELPGPLPGVTETVTGNSTAVPPTVTPTPFHINNFIDTANSSAIATLISAYANVTFADMSKFNESMMSNGTQGNISEIFPSIHRRPITTKPHLPKESDPAGVSFCRMQCFFSNLGNFVTIWTLAAISADRFFAHTWPLKYNEMVTRQKFAIFMAYIWLQGIFFSSLSIEFWTRDPLLDSGVASGFCHCTVNWLYIPRNAPMGVAFFKLLAFLWMSLTPYTIILVLSSMLVYRLLMAPETVVTTLSGEELPADATSPFDRSGIVNPVNRFFQANPQQEQMIWRVMPPPLSPSFPGQESNMQGPYGNPPLKELFSGSNQSFAGSQIRRSRLLELHRMSITPGAGGKFPVQGLQREATTVSVLTCYLAVILSYMWLQTTPGCFSFLLFVVEGGQGSFLIAEMIAFLFKLIGFSVNAGIYFWLRKDFHDAFSGLFRQLCACDRGARTGPQGQGQGQGGVIPGVVVGEEW